MAKLLIKSILAGPAFSADPGQVVDCDEALAVALVAGGYAVRIGAPPAPVATARPVEVAVAPAAPETTMLAPPVPPSAPAARGRKRG